VRSTGLSEEIESLALLFHISLEREKRYEGLTSAFGSSMAETKALLSVVTDRIVSVRPCKKPRVLALSYVALTYP
jgi:hypothetical protein